jgi:hypothetical protein
VGDGGLRPRDTLADLDLLDDDSRAEVIDAGSLDVVLDRVCVIPSSHVVE